MRILLLGDAINAKATTMPGFPEESSIPNDPGAFPEIWP
jgi:hypothetical protein